MTQLDVAASTARSTATAVARAVVDNVERVIRGQRPSVEAAVTALIAGGHVLIEDVPGVGKTMLARSLARSVDGEFKRVQGTPDLLPSDLTGTSVFDQRTQSFTFIPGPVFANVMLFDELNRTSPRTQAALLEALDEGAVTVDGVRHQLPDPLFVIATQNPLEQHGTYPLPEGELDRFLVAIGMGYVHHDAERDLIRAQLLEHPIGSLPAVVSAADLATVRRIVRQTHVSDPVLEYALALIHATREHPDLQLGASPRASIALVRCAQARAVLSDRDFVTPDDVKTLAPSVLGHRIIPRGRRADSTWRAGLGVITQIIGTVPVPVPTAG